MIIFKIYFSLSLFSFSVFSETWLRFGCIPEQLNWDTLTPTRDGYPLRPEVAESLYYLHSATGYGSFLFILKDCMDTAWIDFICSLVNYSYSSFY